MRIGTNCTYHRLDLQWQGDTLLMTRQGVFLAEFGDISGIREEYARVEESQQDVMLLRLQDRHGNVHVLFIDNDPVQTNVRLVSDELNCLADVYAWLLPLDYAYRQGDVGLYLRDSLPPGMHEISAEHYAEYFVEILSKRHSFAPSSSFQFYVGGGAHYVRVLLPARLVHPEHEAQPLTPGLYQLIGARGLPLPQFVGLQHGESAEREI